MLKRVVDIMFSLSLVVLLSPLMVIAAGLIVVTMGWPPIFTQPRAGLHGRAFTLYKFRTMKNTRGQDGEMLPDAARLTKFGVMIRKLSIDELPQLFNVIKGDMSVVGPRPLLPNYLQYYTPEQARRHDVKPGITGLAQIIGRHTMPFLKRLELDIYYVNHRNFWMDLKIVVMTLPKVLGRSGVIEGTNIGTGEALGLNALAALKKQGGG